MGKIFWKPSPHVIKESHMMRFMHYVNTETKQHLKTYRALYRWSIEHPEAFWLAMWNYSKVIASASPKDIMVPAKKMQHTKWFPGAKLNFAENLLRRRDQHIAIFFVSERGDRYQMTYSQLYLEVASLAAHLRSLGVGVGDRVVGCLPNIPQTVIAMLAATSIGAIWSSCSPDFGLKALVDRFNQIEPKILFTVDAYTYKGKQFNILDRIKQLQSSLPTLIQTIIYPYIDKQPNIKQLTNTYLYHDCLPSDGADKMTFKQLPFDHPVYILYSSGTTGKPKCMVHGAGGTLLQHMKELMLHSNFSPQHRILFYTTCGWMMWNWFVSSLAIGAAIVLYDGAPFHPQPTILFDLIDEIDINYLGLGAKLLENAAKQKVEPIKTNKLTRLYSILTTGSPLLPETYDYVHNKVKPYVRLASISGGSDIISCFALGNPILPVYQGELQCIGLGMNVKIFNDKGKSVIAEKGELVCTAPFPSMPVYFWNDPDGQKYQQAYFDKFPNIWTHGDYAEITNHGGMIIYGRSDATLNPGGIRIGTAEIYLQMDKIDEVIESLAIGQEWQGSERIILFIVLRPNVNLTNDLIQKIKDTIRKNASPHHVPAKIIAVPDIPRTINDKIVELAVKQIIHNKPVKNKEALANPEALDYFKNLKELNF